MATRDIIVIGASAGGVQALSKLISQLPATLPAAVFIVLHLPSDPPRSITSNTRARLQTDRVACHQRRRNHTGPSLHSTARSSFVDRREPCEAGPWTKREFASSLNRCALPFCGTLGRSESYWSG